MNVKRSMFVLVCLVALALAVFGQTDRGTITGTIQDQAKAVVPNAKIELKSQASGATFSGGSSSSGNYVFANLPAGDYTLTVTMSGFKKFVRENLTVVVATDTRADVDLVVGNQTDVITVSEAAPLLKTESGELSHSVTIDQADNLPVLTLTGSVNPFGGGFGNIRDPLAVSQLLPGVSFLGSDGGIVVNGIPASTEAIRIEGQDATNGMWRQVTQINQSGVDAIQEVSVQTSNFAAEFGQAAGGYFNFTMKSGTNQFHGSAYLYYVNEFLNAGLPFTDAGLTDSLRAGQHIRNAVHRNDYGFTVGGPVRIPKVYNGHDKSFFFFNFEQFRENRTTGNSTQTVPTAAYQTGNFATANQGQLINFAGFKPAVDSLGNALINGGVYDPASTRIGPDGNLIRTYIPNQQLPSNEFDKVALAIQAFSPQPTNSGIVNNYSVPTYSNYQHTTNFSVKGDHSLSPTVKISGYYSHIITYNPSNNGIPIVSGQTLPISQVSATNNRSTTVRLNYDQTLKPTLLLHLGAGYLGTYSPSTSAGYNEASLGATGACPNATFILACNGMTGYYNTKLFPNIGGTSSFATGGQGIGIGPGGFQQELWDQKPTGNANLTWVKSNHTFKFGAELVIEGMPDHSLYRANGNLNFSNTETGDPDQNGLGLNGSTGFNYASFLTGSIDNISLSPPTQTKLGNHAIGLFAQDSWKVSRKLTVDYGIRYDYATYLREQYGRMQSGAFSTLNPTVGRLGAVVYEGGPNPVQLSHNYPDAWGPRLGFAYQINTKTVLRAGAGIQYQTAANNAFLSYNVADFYNFSGPGYGQGLSYLSEGNPYATGNPYGNPVITWPNFDRGKYPTITVCPPSQPGGVAGLAKCRTPQSPFISMDRSSRPPRVLTWSIGLQREIFRNLVVEASYVGNRGAWFTAPELQGINYNALPYNLSAFGLDITNSNDRSLLSSQISNPTAIQRGFGGSPYVGYPVTQTVGNSIRPVPQFGNGVPPFLGPPLGDSWYDSLQVKVTKRYSHGLDMQGSFTWDKNEVLGTSADTQYFTPGTPLINDVYNREQNKQIAQNGRPIQIVISGTYTVPKPAFTQNKLLSEVLRDWQIGTVLRYQSGALLQSPPSGNNLLSQLQRGSSNNPATWGGGYTFYNQVAGQPFFMATSPASGAAGTPVDPNCRCFNPQTQLLLNPIAWADPGPGNFGVAAPFYNQNRWKRQPSEAFNFGRNFRLGPERKYNLQIRAEFQNVFNRTFLSTPADSGGFFATNPATRTTYSTVPGQTNLLTGGFGYVNTIGGGGAQPRSGQLIARFTF